jgi:hypothetical protein
VKFVVSDNRELRSLKLLVRSDSFVDNHLHDPFSTLLRAIVPTQSRTRRSGHLNPETAQLQSHRNSSRTASRWDDAHVQRRERRFGVSIFRGLWFALYSSPMALTKGQNLGPYQIISSLGAGGMGEVYRAGDTRLQRDVAIKHWHWRNSIVRISRWCMTSASRKEWIIWRWSTLPEFRWRKN